MEFEKKILIGGILFKLGAMGANVFVEFENVFFNRGHFFSNWGQKIIFGIIRQNINHRTTRNSKNTI